MKPRTEKEDILNNEFNIFRLSKLYQSDKKLFKEVSDYLPYRIYISERSSLKPVYANDVLLDNLELNQKKLYDLGYNLIKSLSEENIRNQAISRIRSFEQYNDFNSICSYYQFMKFRDKWSWYLTNKVILGKTRSFNIMNDFKSIGKLGLEINSILGDTLLMKNGWEKFKTLTKTEKLLLKDLSRGKSMELISQIRHVSIATIRTHRKNLMRKIDAHNIIDIISFAKTFQLIGDL